MITVQRQLARSLLGLSDLLLGGLLGFGTAAKFLLIGLLSLAALIASLAIVCNRTGRRKRAWIELAACQGASQLLFGAGYIVAVLVACVAIKLSFVLAAGFMLLSLIMLMIQALELHDVEKKHTFVTVTLSVAIYVILFSIVWMIIF